MAPHARPLQDDNSATTRDNQPTASVQDPENSSGDCDVKVTVSRHWHWPFLHAFGGSWLRHSLKTLEALRRVVRNTPPPHPIDLAVLNDLIKVRGLVDEAERLACKAQAGQGSTFVRSNKMSSQWAHRHRALACHLLSQAYRIDEFISTTLLLENTFLQDVADQVLRRRPADIDAKYVQFFHETGPCREIAVSTSPEQLTEILAASHAPEILRTRAMGNFLLRYLDAAIEDLTEAISKHRYAAAWKHHLHKESGPVKAMSQQVPMPEDEESDDLLGQLLFHRGSIYLRLAYRHISTSFAHKQESAGAPGALPADKPAESLIEEDTASQECVKAYAKRAMRDLMAFIKRFQYSPDWPVKAALDFADLVKKVTAAEKPSRVSLSVHNSPPASNHLFSVSELFGAVPPTGLPPYPPPEAFKANQSGAAGDLVKAFADETETPSAVCEAVAYHPFLVEALHALLICHCLAQTSPEDIERHAYMVARLTRICDGFPFFQPCEPPSRGDWNELLRFPASDTGLLPLVASWNDLCAGKHVAVLTYARFYGAAATTSPPAARPGDDLFISSNEAELSNHAIKQMFYAHLGNLVPSNKVCEMLARPGCRPLQYLGPLVRIYMSPRRHAHDIWLWRKEAPVVPSPPRPKKKKKNLVVAAKTFPAPASSSQK
ncbi:hypothetical protein V2A60_000825 [Cordyceps javanica]